MVDRVSRFGPVNWPPRSCDLIPVDYFLWGYVKSLAYADKPQTLDHLEDTIRSVIADIRPQMLEKVIENWTSRLDYIRASHGSPMPEIIFKMGVATAISAVSITRGPQATGAQTCVSTTRKMLATASLTKHPKVGPQRKRKLDETGASEINRLHPKSRRKG
ncbi:uncharacterized protein TNCV_202641 [Trichonephila clavipes]|nr:uncharacterized protein TNCV_202641 [Trichonephila clavipes]